jgi:KDO2-lipid IV(A) lauroyltransferase
MLGYGLRCFALRAAIVRSNLKIAYPEDPEKWRSLYRQGYRHLGRLLLELLMVLGFSGKGETTAPPMKKFVEKNSTYEGLEHWLEARSRGRGVLFLSSHVGNWEVMVATGGHLCQIDLMMVTKRIKPAWLHRAIEQGRFQCGVRATYEPKTLKDVLRHLKSNGTVGFVLDQFAGAPIGVRVPLFGVPVGTPNMLATLAKRTGAVVVPVLNYRLPDGKFHSVIERGLEWKTHEDPQYELALNTAYYTQTLERHIRAHPDQWLWVHRRFKGNLSDLRPGEWNEGRARK